MDRLTDATQNVLHFTNYRTDPQNIADDNNIITIDKENGTMKFNYNYGLEGLLYVSGMFRYYCGDVAGLREIQIQTSTDGTNWVNLVYIPLTGSANSINTVTCPRIMLERAKKDLYIRILSQKNEIGDMIDGFFSFEVR